METSLKKLLEVNETPEYKIFCDMDGVLTDFEKRFDHFAGTTPKEYENEKGTKAFWNLIDVEVGLGFWSKMPWMKEGKQLWEYISKYNPTLLTSPSRDNNSRLGKNTWVKENLSPPPKVIFAYSSDKQRYAQNNHILIDDKKSNISEWISKGGIGIRCIDGNVAPVIETLKTLGL